MKTDAEEAPLVSGEADPNAAPADDQPPPPPPPSGGKGQMLCLIMKAGCLVLLVIVIGCAYGAFLGGYSFKRVMGTAKIEGNATKLPALKKEDCKKNKDFYEEEGCPFYNGGMYLDAANLVFTMIVLGLVIFAIVAEVKKMPAAQKAPTLMLVGGVVLVLGSILEIASAALTASNSGKQKDHVLKGTDKLPEDQRKKAADRYYEGHKKLGMKTGVKFAAGIMGIITGILFIVTGVMGLRAKKDAEARASQAAGGGGDADPYQQQFPPDALSAPDQRQSQSQSQQ